jgi:hypothetical protein
MSETETRRDDTLELASGRTRHSDQGFPPPGSMRTAWKVRLGYALWAAVAILALFGVLNRLWLDWYHLSEFQAQDRWHDWPKDPIVDAAGALAFLGVWWEAGRIDRPWLRRTTRIAWIVGPILALAALYVLFAAAAGRAML